MAAFDTTRTTYGAASFIGRIGALLNRVLQGVIVWNEARNARKSLNKLSDRALEDIGLSRADINAIAKGKPIF